MSPVSIRKDGSSNRQTAEFVDIFRRNFFKIIVAVIVLCLTIGYFCFSEDDMNKIEEAPLASTVIKTQNAAQTIVQQQQQQQPTDDKKVETPKKEDEKPNPQEQQKTPQAQVSGDDSTNNNNSGAKSSSTCEQYCSRKQQRRNKYGSNGNNLLDAKNLLQLVSKEKEKMIQQLKQDYGEDTYKKIFEDGETGKTRGLSMFVGATDKETSNSTDISYLRLRRKLILKIFQVQQNVIEENKNNHDCGDCSGSSTRTRNRAKKNRRRHLLQQHRPQQQQQPLHHHHHHRTLSTGGPNNNNNNNLNYVKYVFAAGGHSSAAAHGNFHREQYANVLERTVHNVFESIGIDFQGRNHAMGGYESAPEVALCQEAVYGKDIDALSWDFAMLDGRDFYFLMLYSERAGKMTQEHDHYNFVNQVKSSGDDKKKKYRQTLTRFDINGAADSKFDMRVQIARALDRRGLSNLYLNASLWSSVLQDAIPDTLGLTEEQIEKMPKFVQAFKCDGEIEKGEPECGEHKYNNTICKERAFKASWHPGWKWHGLHGFLFAIFFVDALLDAIQQIIVAAGEGQEAKQKLYDDCVAKETADFERFLQSDLIARSEKIIERVTKEKEQPLSDEETQEILQVLFKAPQGFCYTALMPSEQRFRGLVTGNQTQIQQRNQNEISLKSDFIHYDTGDSLSIAKEQYQEKDHGQFRLTFDEESRKELQSCPQELTHADYKDFFFIQASEGWTSLKIPTKDHIEYYQLDMSKVKGLIVMCPTVAPYGKYWPDEVTPGILKDIGNNNSTEQDLVNLEINGQPVTSVVGFHRCKILKGHDGFFWKPKTTMEDGAAAERYYYELRVRVKDPVKYFRISSVIIL